MQNQIDNNEIYNENEKERAFLISVDTGDFDALVSIKELETCRYRRCRGCRHIYSKKKCPRCRNICG